MGVKITLKRQGSGYDYWITGGGDDRLLASGWARGIRAQVYLIAEEHAREKGLTIDG